MQTQNEADFYAHLTSRTPYRLARMSDVVRLFDPFAEIKARLNLGRGWGEMNQAEAQAAKERRRSRLGLALLRGSRDRNGRLISFESLRNPFVTPS